MPRVPRHSKPLEERMRAVAAAVSRALEQVGWTQRRLAEEADLSTSTVSRILAGEILPEPDTLRAIADVLPNVTYYQLMAAAGYLDEDVPMTAEDMLAWLRNMERTIASVRSFLEAQNAAIRPRSGLGNLGRKGESPVPTDSGRSAGRRTRAVGVLA